MLRSFAAKQVTPLLSIRKARAAHYFASNATRTVASADPHSADKIIRIFQRAPQAQQYSTKNDASSSTAKPTIPHPQFNKPKPLSGARYALMFIVMLLLPSGFVWLYYYNWQQKEEARFQESLKDESRYRALIYELHENNAITHEEKLFLIDHIKNFYKNGIAKPAESAIRFLRACYYVGRIMVEYKLFFNKKLERESEEYRVEFARVNTIVGKLLLALCQKNQGSFVKAGQYLATLQYVLPREITDSLQVMQDRAPVHSFEQTIEIFKQDFNGKTPLEVFETFETEPIASASIAQVHVATTRDTKEKVAVKIQHPRLMQLFEADVRTMSFLMWVCTQFFDFRLTWVMDEFKKMILSELNFVNEASNCERLRHVFRDNPQVLCPQIKWNLTGNRVITMEFMEGFKVTNVERMDKEGISKAEVANLIANAYSKQIFEYGFVHADPHGGNIFVRMNKQTGKPEIVILDHGCYKELDEQTRLNYAGLWHALVFRNEELMEKYTASFNINPKYARVLGMMMTFSNMFDASKRGQMLDQRDTRKMSPEERKELAKKIKKSIGLNEDEKIDGYNIMQDMMANIHPAFILLSRTNAYIRSIMYLYERPINSYAIMAEHCVRGFNTRLSRHERIVEANNGKKHVIPIFEIVPLEFKAKLNMYYELFSMRVRTKILEWLAWVAQWYFGLLGGKTVQPATEPMDRMQEAAPPI